MKKIKLSKMKWKKIPPPKFLTYIPGQPEDLAEKAATVKVRAGQRAAASRIANSGVKRNPRFL